MKPRQLSYHMIVFCKTEFGVIVIFCLLSCRKERALILLIIFILQANPKTRGYLWFCTECDESVSDWDFWITRGGIFRTITVGRGGEGGYSLIFAFLVCAAPKGRVFAPFWSEIGYRLCLFWSEFGYGFRGNAWTCMSFQFQMNKKERVICEFEVDLKKSFSWHSNPRIVNFRLADTAIIPTAAKSQAKINFSRLTEINSHYFGLSLMRTLTGGPYSVRFKGSWL